MKLIDVIKNFFNKNKSLPAPSQTENGASKNRGNSENPWRVEKLASLPKEHQLEECIAEFIKQYTIQEDINPKSNSKSYKAFRRLFCDQEEPIRKK